MILLDLFSGIGGFHKGLADAGFNFKKTYFSEIDKYAIANYKYNFKDAEHIGTVESILESGIERPDIITAGSPCQDFSLAGKRAGLAGARSSLVEHFIAAIAHFRPGIFIWENVKGTFSSNNGADFWAIIQAFTNIGGYRIEWQLLNTLWFLPQNRERIYLVGRLADRCRGEVFPVGENGEIFSQNPDAARKQAEHGSDMPVILTHYGHKDKSPRISDVSPTLKAQSHGHEPMVKKNSLVRRLTEVECERLQGYPDNWTKYGNFDGETKEISGTQRYKMLGNSVTAKIVQLVGGRIINSIF